ncbi:hypothetical protein NUSPORA_00800 [Nucleospora cyclopteri]
MRTTKSFKVTSFITISSNLLLVLITFIYIGLFISHFQFWRLENLLFKNEIFTLVICIKVQSFINLFTSLFSTYSMNVASKFIMRITGIMQVIGIFTTLIFILLLHYSYKQNFKSIIQTSYLISLDIQMFIKSRYAYLPANSKKTVADLCIEEMGNLIDHCERFLVFSFSLIVLVYFLTKVVTFIKISQPDKVLPEIDDINNAAMNTENLNKIKVVVK